MVFFSKATSSLVVAEATEEPSETPFSFSSDEVYECAIIDWSWAPNSNSDAREREVDGRQAKQSFNIDGTTSYKKYEFSGNAQDMKP